MTKKLNFKYIAPIITFAFVTSAFTPAKDTFTAAEQQQISITTPGLFSRSNTFSIDLSTLKAGDYVFPLPVGKAELTDNGQSLEIKTKDSVGRKYGEKREDKEEKRYYTNYYFNQNHSLETGWLYDQSNWYYLAKTEINGENFIGGERRAGWINDDSTWYYLDPTTAAMQTGWQYLGNKWYYLRSSGAMATGWYQEDSTWYYLDSENGDMKTGWQYLGNKWYYLRSSGAMATGWVKDGSTWYYLNASNGDMKTGWAKVNGNWYYLNSNGAMVTGSQTIDGKVYNFASSGEWI